MRRQFEALPAEPDPADARKDDVDAWGRSEHLRELVRKVGRFYYERWFRVEWEGLEKIPLTGGALLIANHGGAIPADAPMIMQGIETELGRPVYGLADHWFRTVPVLGTLWNRAGGIPAHPDNAHRLLHDDGQLGKALGMPYVPVTINHLLLGPVLGTLVYLPAKFRFRVLDPVIFDVEPALERYPLSRVVKEADAIRQRVQDELCDMLAGRASVWFG